MDSDYLLNNLNDRLNLRGFVITIIEYCRRMNLSEPRTISIFFEMLLPNDDNKVNRVKMLTKLLSGGVPWQSNSVQTFAKGVCSGSIDIGQGVSDICAVFPDTSIYDMLVHDVNPRFFSPDEISMIRKLHGQSQFEELITVMIRHGLSSMFNIPFFFAERIYKEALTIDYDREHRYILLRIAAEYNRDAALAYGNYLMRAKKGPDSGAEEYFLMALPNDCAAWSLSYLVQQGWVRPEFFSKFRDAYPVEKKLDDMKDSNLIDEKELEIRYIGSDSALSEIMVFIYKVYLFLGYSAYFVKGFNSCANLLFSGTIRVGSIQESEKLCLKYRQLSINGCNLIAMQNEGNRLRKEVEKSGVYDSSSPKESLAQEQLRLAASSGLRSANFFLAEHLKWISGHDQIDRREEIGYFYRNSERLDIDGQGMGGHLYIRLAEISDDSEEKKKYYELALKKQLPEAAYYLAELAVRRYISGEVAHKLEMLDSLNVLQKYLPLMSLQKKGAAERLYEVLTKELNKPDSGIVL